MRAPLRIGLGGFLHESNTFLGKPTEYGHFVAASFTRGAEVLGRWRGSHHELGGMIAELEAEKVAVVPLLATFAIPSGTLTAECFERICAEMLAELAAAGPLDGLLLALHGATVSADFRDADGELLRRVRQQLGREVPVVATLDLHANVSPQMATEADALLTYRTNPHLDQEACGQEAARLLLLTCRGQARPVTAFVQPPLLLPIAKQHTGSEPASWLYEAVSQVRQWPGILSASIAFGFYYADVAEMGASAMAVADGDHALAQRAAQYLGERMWALRQHFLADLPTARQAVQQVIARQSQAPQAGPVVVMDVGDNVGAGSPADSTLLLEEAMAQGAPPTLAVLYAPTAVEACVAAGVGATVQVSVGFAKMQGEAASQKQPAQQMVSAHQMVSDQPETSERRKPGGLPLHGRVRALSDGRFQEREVRHGGWGNFDQGPSAVLELADGHTVLLTSRRMAPMSLRQLLHIGLQPDAFGLVVAKGVVAPRAAYAPIAADIILVDTPGVTSNNPAHFSYQYARSSLYPVDEGCQWRGE